MVGVCPYCEREFPKRRSSIVFCTSTCHHRHVADERRRHLVPPPPVDNARWVPLTKGKFCLVDEEDYAWITETAHWCFSKLANSEGGYAVATIRQQRVYLHALLLDRDGKEVDHRNRDSLDNRRANLRVATHAQNVANKIQPKRGASTQTRFIGVHPTKRPDRFVVLFGGKYVGTYNSQEAAADAYDVMAAAARGEYAVLNRAQESAR